MTWAPHPCRSRRWTRYENKLLMARNVFPIAEEMNMCNYIGYGVKINSLTAILRLNGSANIIHVVARMWR